MPRVTLTVFALVLAVVLVPASFGLATLERGQAEAGVVRALAGQAIQQRADLTAYLARARAIVLITSRNSAFRDFYSEPGGRLTKVRAGGRSLDRANAALAYLERLYPVSIGEACFIDESGAENARVVRDKRAVPADLSFEEADQPFFGPTFALPAGMVHHARPYRSPDTGEWVVANATQVPLPRGGPRAIVHFEVSVESFRRAAVSRDAAGELFVIDRSTGRVVVAGETVQRAGAPLGLPADRRFAALRGIASDVGTLEVGGRTATFRRLHPGRGNANDWVVIAVARSPAGSLLASLDAGPLGMLIAAGLLLAFAVANLRAGALRREAETDELTGLANRRNVMRRLRRALEDATRRDVGVALLMIDLNNFKEINDTLGHSAGDMLLRHLGPRLQEGIGARDVLARLGGDEFAVVIGDLRASGGAEQVAQRVADTLKAPFALDGMTVHVEAAIGIAMFPEHADDALDLLQHADVAMYQAKRAKTSFEVYGPQRDGHSRERIALAGELRRALVEDELVLHYQPKVDIATAEIVGVEALVRWQHPARGLLAPDRFLPSAEQTGFMRELTLHVLDHALAQLAAWKAGGHDLVVAVNISAVDLMDVEFPAQVTAALDRHDVDPAQLQLEITETMIMADSERIVDVLGRLGECGVGLSLDDFGTGFSSFAHLRNLPVDELKIDRSFVQHMTEGDNDSSIVRATIELAHGLGLSVVAEGIETETALRALEGMGCDLAQGYLVARPLAPETLQVWLRAGGAASNWSPRPLLTDR